MIQQGESIFVQAKLIPYMVIRDTGNAWGFHQPLLKVQYIKKIEIAC